MAAGYAGVGTVNVSGSVTAAETDYTPLLTRIENQASASTANIFTVTSGKTARIIHAIITVSGSGFYWIEKSDGTKRLINGVVASGQQLFLTFPYNAAPTYASGEVVRINAGAGVTVYLTMWYIEVTN